MTSLAGKQVVVTRAASQAGPLVDLLCAQGAAPVLFPCIDVSPPDNIYLLDAALDELKSGRFDWLVFTSANAVSAIAGRLTQPLQISIRIAAVGPGTGAAVERLLGAPVSVTPESALAGALPAALGDIAGTRILLPQADIAGPALSDMLMARGAAVHVVTAYKTLPAVGGENVALLLRERRIDAVTLCSGSAARNFVQRLSGEGGSAADLAGVCIACIGPSTAAEAEASGLRVDVVSQEHTLVGLVDALGAYFSRQSE